MVIDPQRIIQFAEFSVFGHALLLVFVLLNQHGCAAQSGGTGCLDDLFSTQRGITRRLWRAIGSRAEYQYQIIQFIADITEVRLRG